MPQLSVEELINKGPTNDNSPSKVGDVGSNDKDSIDVDEFDRIRVEGLDPETSKILEQEEANAKKKGDIHGHEDNKDDSNKDDKPVDEEVVVPDKETVDTTKKETVVEGKETEKSSDVDLLHLELGISPGAVPLLKKMDKSAREFVVSELKTRYQKISELNLKVKELSENGVKTGDGNGLSNAWYEHPQAYHLLPEYQQKVRAVTRAEELIGHYDDQLKAIRDGEVWTDLEAGPDGSVVQKQYKPTSQAERVVTAKVRELNNALLTLRGQAEEVKHNFNQNNLKTRESVTALENQYFPQYADSKALEKDTNWVNINRALDKFGLGNDRLSKVTAKMYIYAMSIVNDNEAKNAKIKELEEQIKSGAKSKLPNNGPTGDEINRGDNKPGKKYDNPDDEPMDMDEFDKRLAAGR